MEIRLATPDDLPGLKAVCDPYIRHSHSTFHTTPLPAEVWEARQSSTHPGDQVFVAVEDGEVLGGAWSTEYRARAAYDATRETSVYLAEGTGGRGIGRRLYDALLAGLTDAGMHTAVAAVALPNDASERLHLACGFETVGTFRELGHKLDRWIDVRWFQRML